MQAPSSPLRRRGGSGGLASTPPRANLGGFPHSPNYYAPESPTAASSSPFGRRQNLVAAPLKPAVTTSTTGTTGPGTTAGTNAANTANGTGVATGAATTTGPGQAAGGIGNPNEWAKSSASAGDPASASASSSVVRVCGDMRLAIRFFLGKVAGLAGVQVDWFDSPVCLFVALACLVVFMLGEDTRNNYFIVLPDFAPAVPLWWFRLVSHIFGHISWAHLSGNLSLILLLGPNIERAYGAAKFAGFVLLTAFITGAVHTGMSYSGSGRGLNGNVVGLCGSSCVVFMCVAVHAVLARRATEATRRQQQQRAAGAAGGQVHDGGGGGGGIPLTFILTAAIYMSKEATGAIKGGRGGGVSHASHFVGGVVGALLAMYLPSVPPSGGGGGAGGHAKKRNE